MKRIPHATLDSVEKMLLGAAPDDLIDVAAQPVGATPDPRAARLDLVRKFLAKMPSSARSSGRVSMKRGVAPAESEETF